MDTRGRWGVGDHKNTGLPRLTTVENAYAAYVEWKNIKKTTVRGAWILSKGQHAAVGGTPFPGVRHCKEELEKLGVSGTQYTFTR